MKRSYGLLAGLTLVAMVCAQTACALTVVYVTTDGTGDGSSWVSATNSIQGAVDVIDDSNATNTVAVSNGVYNTGGADGYPGGGAFFDGTSNRVAIYKVITVRAASSDPADTIIVGAPGTIGTNAPYGTGAVRCVYITNGASLHGFTLSNGYTRALHAPAGEPNTSLRGGGIFCGQGGTPSSGVVISNCVVKRNQSWYHGGGTVFGTFYDCTIVQNTSGADYNLPNFGAAGGGGAKNSNLYNCNVISNWSKVRGGGGGVAGITGSTIISNCFIAYNSAGSGNVGISVYNPHGGGGVGGTYYDCTIVSNVAKGQGQAFGGGVGNTSIFIPDTNSVGQQLSSGGRLFNCLVAYNTSDGHAGGIGKTAFASNCVIRGNQARDGGGLEACIVYDCLIVGNSGGRDANVGQSSIATRCTIISNKTVTRVDGSAGGANNAFLTNCLIAYNTGEDNNSPDAAGGAKGCELVNCTIVGNTSIAPGGGPGGVLNCTLINSISRENIGIDDTGNTPTYSDGVGADYSSGVGNTTDDPLFVDSAAGNFRLTPHTSPGIDTGLNQGWMTTGTDLDGSPRIFGPAVDMGAFEDQTKRGTLVQMF